MGNLVRIALEQVGADCILRQSREPIWVRTAQPDFGIGEALVSTLDERGQPTMVERTLVRPPNSRVGPITSAERAEVIEASPVEGKYPEKPRDDTADQERLQEWADKPAKAKTEAKAETNRNLWVIERLSTAL